MSNICKNWSQWLATTRFSYMSEVQKQQTINWLILIRNKVLELADIKNGEYVADFGCGSGLLGFGVLEKFEDRVKLIFSDKFQDCLDECEKILKSSSTPSDVEFLKSDIAKINLKDNILDCAMTRSVLVHIVEKQPAFDELFRVLKKGGRYCAFEPIISQNTRYYELLSENDVSDYNDFKNAEKDFMERKNDPLVNFNSITLEENLKNSGFENINIDTQTTSSTYIPLKENILQWFVAPPAPDQKTMKERYLEFFEEKKVDNFIAEVSNALNGKEITVEAKVALIKAIK